MPQYQTYKDELTIQKRKVKILEKMLEDKTRTLYFAKIEAQNKSSFLESIYKSMNDMLFVINNDGKIRIVNQAAQNILGYSKSEIEGQDFSILIEEEEEEEEEEDLISRLTKQGFIGKVEKILITKDGGNIPVLFSGAVTYNNQGKPCGIVGVAIDITERKKSENELSKSEERYRLLYESNTDAIMTLDPPDWKFRSANRSAIKMFGAKDENEITKLGSWIVSPEKQPGGELSREKAKLMIELAMREGSNYFEWYHRRLNGEVFPSTVLLSKITAHGLEFLQATVRDISGQKNAEKEKEEMQRRLLQATKLAAVGELAGGVAHELNNPLAVIQSYTDQIEYVTEEKILNVMEIKESVDGINKNIKRMVKIINHLKSFGREHDEVLSEYNINDIIDSSFYLFGRQLTNKNIDVITNYSEDIIIIGDRNQLEQVFINLLLNSRDAMENSEEKIINISSEINGNDAIIIFEDTGSGIEKNIAEKIFNPFFTTKKIGMGTGLGLSVTHEIIKNHRGEIVFENTEKGAKFRIKLPLSDYFNGSNGKKT